MSVSIRLSKIGKKHAPSYRVVVTKTRNKRDGAFIDIIGHYNPSDKTKEFVIDKKLYEDWVSKGAIVSDAVKKLIEGTYEYKKYEPKTSGAKDDNKVAPEETKEETKEEKEEKGAKQDNKEE